MSRGRLQELKNNRKSLNFQAQISGRSRLLEVVVYEKWPHMEVRLYMPDKGHVIIIIINTQGQIAQMYFMRKVV